MPSDRDAAGGTFNNTYDNGTLVGNWLEDRLQRRINAQVGPDGSRYTLLNDDGVLEDPRVTRGPRAAQVRQDLMGSTYAVDYGRQSTDGVHGAAANSVLVPKAARPPTASGAGAVVGGKEGLNRALLFSKDPVSDPSAELPESTNTATYGAFARTDGGSGGAERRSTHGNGPTVTEERSLYDSVCKASAGKAGTTNALASTAKRGSRSAALAAPLTATLGFSSLAAPAGDGRGCGGEAVAEGEERWCSTKQAADVPVEHFVLQRRLPPVRM